MTPRPPLLDTAEARGAVEVWAMPAKRIGWVMDRRIVSLDDFGVSISHLG